MKQRLDLLLVERGLAPSRAVAQAMIMAGAVKQGSSVLSKPGQLLPADTPLAVTASPRYVSRGGDKLASVAEALQLDCTGAVVLDVGASTGGFTDYVLQHGAIEVFAVDTGTAQLAYALRQDSRVHVMERTDVRSLTPEQLNPRPTLAVIDVSFISLTKVLPAVAALIAPGAAIIALAKPQFESDKPTADRYHGVIRDEAVRQRILSALEAELRPAFITLAAADSGLAGAKGNRERFYRLQPRPTTPRR